MKRAIACTLAFALTGCSFLAVNGPDIPAGTMPMPGDSFDCTELPVVPVIDAVLGTVILLGAIAALIDSRDPDGRPQSGEAALAFGAVAVLYGVGSAVGFSRVADCRRANDL